MTLCLACRGRSDSHRRLLGGCAGGLRRRQRQQRRRRLQVHGGSQLSGARFKSPRSPTYQLPAESTASRRATFERRGGPAGVREASHDPCPAGNLKLRKDVRNDRQLACQRWIYTHALPAPPRPALGCMPGCMPRRPPPSCYMSCNLPCHPLRRVLYWADARSHSDAKWEQKQARPT